MSLSYINISRYILKICVAIGVWIYQGIGAWIYQGIGTWIYQAIGAWIYQAAWPASKPAGFGGWGRTCPRSTHIVKHLNYNNKHTLWFLV